ncbi:MAG TPA: hypothetical protein VLT45_18185 [Kofleriaceae bacterium]|nr:hypothetical protein [Kofleriaceae bacterium]
MTRWFLLLLSGCSMALSGPSADRPRGKPPQCDTSKGLVVVDGLVATTLGIVAASVAASNNGGAAVLPLLGAGIFTASAIHGNNVVNACNREMTNYDSELAAARPPLPDEEPRSIEPRQPMVAMQPAVALPSQPPLQPRPPLQPQPQPQPAPQQQQPQEAAAEPWAAFWKETP